MNIFSHPYTNTFYRASSDGLNGIQTFIFVQFFQVVDRFIVQSLVDSPNTPTCAGLFSVQQLCCFFHALIY